MKTTHDLRDFYERTLAEDLHLLEQKRKGLCGRLAAFGAVMGLLVIMGLLMAASTGAFPILIFVVGFGIAVFFFVTKMLSKGYVMEFKTKIIGRIVEFIDPGLRYEPTGRISRAAFQASEIFKTRPNRYKGDDYVRGKVGKTLIEFSEVNAVYESGSGKNKSRRTVFRGLFFIADFNKHFTCRTVVLPDKAENLFGGFGKLLQSWNISRDQLIKLEDPEFERHFVVYGNDQIQARYILSTSLMARIADFKQKTGRKIYLSFVGSKVYVAVWYARNLFEPKIFRTILDFELLREFFEDLQLAIGIVDDLNLNTRIWSKQ